MTNRHLHFDFPEGMKEFPPDFAALQPENIMGVRIEEQADGSIRICLESEEYYFSMVAGGGLRLGFMLKDAGTVLLKEVSSKEKLPYESRSRITIHEDYKEIRFPLNKECSYAICCRNIILENYDPHSFNDNVLRPFDANAISSEDYAERLRKFLREMKAKQEEEKGLF